MSTTSTHFMSAIEARSTGRRPQESDACGRVLAPARAPRPVARRRPAGRPVAYGTRPAVVHRGAHPLAAGSRHSGDGQEIGITGLIAAALATFLVMAALFGLAHLRAGTPAAAPANTTVVAVRDGETLSDIASRIAPEAGVGAVIDRIVNLNDMTDAGVRPGQLLVVPASGQ
ncbi:LysM peptidoglycan-binding domain-containing protein [Aldersonia kunmingensis]|uniref:LysM peptidoglycan-binding domain-containing protein n=1 Tax=Aldersonia kunmingensis TaxID=408066 RepID=UPI00083342DF|nr:LysM peptidoglycan-binding domain-containing protein [Aldersonia kunmingensis]